MPIGKYKGKHITEILADKSYVDWMKSQPGFLDKMPTAINNIIVHQTIVTGGAASKTPEHNKLQNLFLSKEFQVKFLNHMSPISKEKYELWFNELCKTDKYKECFGDLKLQFSNYAWEKASISTEFEGSFNWDVVINATIPSETLKGTVSRIDSRSGRSEYESWFDDSCRGLRGVYFGTVRKNDYSYCNYASVSREGTFNIEVKPILGDDYPAVLRKMKTQIELSKKASSGSSRGSYGNPVLLVGKFESESATLDQLKAIFKQTGIKVVLLDEILKPEKKAEVQKYVNILEEEYLHMKKKLLAYESKYGELDV